MAMLSENSLLALTNYMELAGYKVNYLFDNYLDSTFGFNKNETVLCSIASKALELINTTEIAGRWLRKTFDYRVKIAETQRPWFIGAGISLICILILVFALFIIKRNEGIKLEKLVGIRTSELNEAQKSANDANDAKSKFLAKMSHEMRTPMNAIIGMTEIALQNELYDLKTAEMFQKINNSGILLLSIINDILDLSKIEAGKLELSLSNYELSSLVNDTVTLNLMRIGSRPIEFLLHVDENTPAMLCGDALRIKQILNNILSNAFKYTNTGVVKMQVSFEAAGGGNAAGDDNVILVFSVSDTGQGMTEEQVSKMFEEYTRFNMEANRTTEGTGLGMNITKNLVSMMKGSISVQSEIGRGSVFTVRLPQKSCGFKAIGKEAAHALRDFKTGGKSQAKRAKILFEPMPAGKVLIVDDVETNLYVAKGLMSPYKLNITTVMSGFDAIGKIKEGNVYDIVFMDHMMPKMDGIEATKLIREYGYGKPIVALTANAVTGQSEVFLANGFNDFISKPIDVRQLNAVLKKYVSGKQPPA
jgi:signal transduction histidine kinase/ActR/RegA family two-component response regulator